MTLPQEAFKILEPSGTRWNRSIGSKVSAFKILCYTFTSYGKTLHNVILTATKDGTILGIPSETVNRYRAEIDKEASKS